MFVVLRWPIIYDCKTLISSNTYVLGFTGTGRSALFRPVKAAQPVNVHYLA